MTDELERESAPKSAPDAGNLLRMLDLVHRLHSAEDEEGLLAAAAAAFSAFLGSAPAVIRITHENGMVRQLAAQAPGESVGALVQRAALHGLPVIDDQPPGGVVFPVRSADRTIGVVYVGHPVAGKAKGPGLQVLQLVAAHVGIGSLSLEQRRAAAASASTAAPPARDVSLRDAKFEFERRLLQLRLDEARGNVAAAARSLDMDRGQLSRLMKKHSLDRAAFRPPKA
jgi:hypothetical protein